MINFNLSLSIQVKIIEMVKIIYLVVLAAAIITQISSAELEVNFNTKMSGL